MRPDSDRRTRFRDARRISIAPGGPGSRAGGAAGAQSLPWLDTEVGLLRYPAVVAAREPIRSDPDEANCDYLDYSGRDDVLAGGVRMVPIDTPVGAFKVWTKRIGNNPALRVLLLHGGPGATHEYLEACDSYLPADGVEYYYYDQLGSAYSDQPDEDSLWELDRFVDEVEQVRHALGLERDSFVLYGHSWGGILAIEYALAHPDTSRGSSSPT